LNVEEYKKKKKERELSEKAEKARTFCLTCFKPIGNCLCKHIKPFLPEMKIVILMHPREFKHERAGTGRLAAACVRESIIIPGVDFTENSEVNSLIDNREFFPVVLYPGEKSLNISEKKLMSEDLGGRQLLVFVIDGTWRMAKKMMKQSKNLHKLTRISFSSTKKSEFTIKHQPHELCLSTIEAIHTLIDDWRKSGGNPNRDHDNLTLVLKQMVDYQIECAKDPSRKSYRETKGYKDPSSREDMRKWTIKSLFYNE